MISRPLDAHESGVPAVYMTPTLPDIYNAIFKAQTSFLLKISRESQLVIVDIVIDERSSYSPLLADEYQLMPGRVAKYV